MAKKHHSRPHYDRNQILQMCNHVARESRMSSGTSYTAMHILTLHVLLEKYGFKQQRLAKVAEYVNDLEKRFDNGEFSEEEMSNRLFDLADFKIEQVDYTEKDITRKKGTFDYWLDERQIEPMNNINRIASKHMTEFFLAMADLYGWRKVRLERLRKDLADSIDTYQWNKNIASEMRKNLLDEGIWIEDAIDPLTQSHSRSIMYG